MVWSTHRQLLVDTGIGPAPPAFPLRPLVTVGRPRSLYGKWPMLCLHNPHSQVTVSGVLETSAAPPRLYLSSSGSRGH